VKNIPSAAQAVMELKNRGYKASLTVIGENQDNDEYNKISTYPCVKMLPFMTKEELIQEYRTHHIFLLPSKGETFGRVYVEAMTQGLPVLYTKEQGFDGNYDDGVVGYSIEAGNYKMIADCIEKTINDYDSISKRCIEKCADFFEEIIMNKVEKFYMDSLSQIMMFCTYR
jgi:glycosyltransferase involved in cell wall biosynthesis